MVNRSSAEPSSRLAVMTWLIAVYIASVIGTIGCLIVLSASAPAQATDDAWGHAIVVAVFGVVLPLRLRSARRGSRRAGVTVGIIAAVLVVVNVVEAAIPGFVPGWMRVEMFGTAGQMAVIGWLAMAGARGNQ